MPIPRTLRCLEQLPTKQMVRVVSIHQPNSTAHHTSIDASNGLLPTSCALADQARHGKRFLCCDIMWLISMLGSEKVKCEYFRLCVVWSIELPVFLRASGRRCGFFQRALLYCVRQTSQTLLAISCVIADPTGSSCLLCMFSIPDAVFRRESTVCRPTIMNQSTSTVANNVADGTGNSFYL